jgi:hypothetical protein
MQVINWRLISNPINWVTLFVMVFIAGIALHFALQGIGVTKQAQTGS